MQQVKPSGNKNKGARPKEYPKPKLVNKRTRPYDRRQAYLTAMCCCCGDSGHYGKLCEKTKDVTCFDCGCFAKVCKSKVKKLHVLSENSKEEREEIFFIVTYRGYIVKSYQF